MTYNLITSKRGTYSFPTTEIAHLDIATRATVLAVRERIDVPREAGIFQHPFMFTFGSPVGKTPVESIDKAILNYLLDEYPLLPVQRWVVLKIEDRMEGFPLPIESIIIERLALEFVPSTDAANLATELRGVLDFMRAEDIPVFIDDSETRVRIPWPNMLTSITI